MKYKIAFAGVMLTVVLLWLLTPLVVSKLYANPTEMGQFGDLFGSINSLFSGLAFSVLIFTIYMQKGELALQREQLKLQREEMVLQREEMSLSRKELENQARVQHLLFLATVGQIQVSGIQAQIEAIKVEAETIHAHSRRTYWESIKSASQLISDIAISIRAEAKDG